MIAGSEVMKKNLILQHWHTANLPDVVTLSSRAVRHYAATIGADYYLLCGSPFDSRLTPPCQKLNMLSATWDDYEEVCMIDADMFPVAGLSESVFGLRGYGIYHPSAHKRVHRQLPKLTSMDAPYWGGAIYCFARHLRVILREYYDFNWARVFNSRGCGEDEGIMHRLALLASWRTTDPVYIDEGWAWPSFEEDFNPTKFVHVRHHPEPKMVQYERLRKKGIIL